MRIAVLSLTRDRLAFTQHCFASLRENAGCDFDHHVLDQASEDGTRDWLFAEEDAGRIGYAQVVASYSNLGVSRGMNLLLERVVPLGYDVIVKFDNDCELTTPGTLKAACEVASQGWIASPHIMGLDSPPSVDREVTVRYPTGMDHTVNTYRIGVPNIMGGIFMAAPASLYASYRHDERNPIWGLDDAKIVDWWRAEQAGEVGYLLDYKANHYLTTEGQRQTYPAYFARKAQEYAA